MPDSASLYRVWNESDGVRFAEVFWKGQLSYDECVVAEYPGDVPPAVKKVLQPMIAAKPKGVISLLEECDFE